MRKLLILPIILIFASTGCESLRRVEVWKQQTFLSPTAATQPVGPPVMAPTATPQYASPVMVQSPIVTESPEQVETLLPGPAETIAPGSVDVGPAF